MSRVNTNNFGLRYAREATLGVKATTGWRTLEPNNIPDYGAKITKVARRPISADRGRRKGTTTNLESSPGVEADLTVDAFDDFAEGFVYAEYANVEFDLKATGDILPPPAVAATDEFTIAAASALLAGKMQWVTGGPFTLVYAKGYTNAANNGLHALVADVASTDTAVLVDGTLVDETPSVNASLQVAGVRSAIGDLAFTKTGDLGTIVSALDITDWSTLGLFEGMYIHVGSDDGTGGRQNHFDDGSTGDVYGYARIVSIVGATLNLDKLDENLDTTDAANATLVDIMFGRFLRNVPVTADADDNRFLEQSYSFEGLYPDLGGAGTDEYEYAIGNMPNELVVNMPLNDKATATWGFTGTTTEDITDSRATGPSTAVTPLRTVAFNTAGDLASLSTDLVTAVSDVCFKSLTLRIRNNASPENCLGSLGARFINTGLFEVNLEGQMLFTRKEIVNAIKNNTTVTFAAIMKNDDGAIAIDMPTATFGGGDREFPVDASVLVNLTGEAFNDPVGTGGIQNVSLGITLFPSVPTDRA